MGNKFNMYSRSEEEKTRDILMYETKAKASEICKKFEKNKKYANITTFIAVIVLSAIAVPFFYKAYDTEKIWAMLTIAIGVAILTVLARFITGAVLSGSLRVYIKWSSLSSKWKAARKEMHDYEAKFADQTVFEPDLKKAEERLMSASHALISFAEQSGICTD